MILLHHSLALPDHSLLSITVYTNVIGWGGRVWSTAYTVFVQSHLNLAPHYYTVTMEIMIS